MRRVGISALGLGLLVLAVLAAGWIEQWRQAEASAAQLVGDPANLPDIKVALVLGTGPLTHWRDGRVTPNIPFVYRLDAAAALWQAGKVKDLIVSGNRKDDYDEPTAMRAGLIERGVPAGVIYRDEAGYRTIYSILRARSVFGLKRLVIVSQRAHVERAMYLARAVGIDAWGLAAREEQPGGPGLAERLTLAAAALRAWADVTVGASVAEDGRPIVIGVDPANWMLAGLQARVSRSTRSISGA